MSGVPTILGRALTGFFWAGFIRNIILVICVSLLAILLGYVLRLFRDTWLFTSSSLIAEWLPIVWVTGMPFVFGRNGFIGAWPILPGVFLVGVVGYVVLKLVRWTESSEFKIAVGESDRLGRIWHRAANFGMGGSAHFGSMLDEWDDLYRSGDVLLGQSLYDFSLIGTRDPRGLITVAGARSGKGRGAIIPNLLKWEGSCLVIDPKGTNAIVTAKARGHGGGRLRHWMGQDVYVVDPFGIVPDHPRAGYNPLAEIDINSDTAPEDIAFLAAALVPEVPSGRSNADHFEDSARNIIAGVIAFVMETLENPTLIDVRSVFTKSGKELDDIFKAMLNSDAGGGLARTGANTLKAAGDQEVGGMMTTCQRHTAWIDSKVMRDVLSRSDFKLADMKQRPTTVYLVLPPNRLKTHKRFLRMFMNMMLRVVPEGGRSRIPILMIMDEFFSLGALDDLADASSALPGYNLRLWPIVHNIGQLKKLYPGNWQTFFANAGAVQMFGVYDEETAGFVVEMLGEKFVEVDFDGKKLRSKVKLIEKSEVMQALSELDRRILIMRAGQPPLLLTRVYYDKVFDRSRYLPDPDHPEPEERRRFRKKSPSPQRAPVGAVAEGKGVDQETPL